MPKHKTIIDHDGVSHTVVKGDRRKGARDGPKDDHGSAGSVSKRGMSDKVLFVSMGVGGMALIVLAAWGVVMLIGSETKHAVVPSDEAGSGRQAVLMLSAEQVARAFLAETDAEKRLEYVRDPEEIKQHLARYTEQARSHPAKEIKLIGHSELNGRAVTAFAVAFDDGSFRMLSLVQTDQGPKVDWDGYARYCSASWQDLFSAKTKNAEVRVFVRPGGYHVGQFRDQTKWTCFKLETPDSNRGIYAYAPAGSRLSKRMQTAVMKSRGFRQHMTLQIKGVNDSGKDALFIVDELLAMGWVR